MPAIEIERMVRAYTPWPGPQTMWDDALLTILKAHAMAGQSDGETGRVVKLSDGAIGVVTGEGVLVLKEIQLAGRKAMKMGDFFKPAPAPSR